MNTTYTVNIGDAYGIPILSGVNFSSLDYTLAENDIGALTITLPGDSDLGQLWKPDGIIEVWRSINGAPPYLDGDKLWQLRHWSWEYHTGAAPQWTLYAFDLNNLLLRRDIDYTAGQPQTIKLDYLDNVCKAIMRENYNSLATDTTRSIATYLTIQADQSLAVIGKVEFPHQKVMQALRNIADFSYQLGTYLVFDIVCTIPPSVGTMAMEFRTYIRQRGLDHTFTSGNPPLLIGPSYNNLDDIHYDLDYTNEITRGIAAGQSFGIAQAVARADDTVRQGVSPFGLIENTRNAGSAANAAALLGEAKAELRSGIPIKAIQGTIKNTSGLTYGIDWKYGDLVQVQIDVGLVADAHVGRVHIHVERDSGDQVEAILRGVVA